MEKYDLIVIGAGPGGYTAALHAASLGKRVCVFESCAVGGTCLNRGCIPTKALLHASTFYKKTENNSVKLNSLTDAFSDMLAQSAQKQLRLQNGILSLFKRAKVELIPERAEIEAPGVVLASGNKYYTDNIIIATGTSPAAIPIENTDKIRLLTSDDILTGNGVDCQSIIIVGGGVIGCEIAELYSNMGRSVTIVEADEHILPRIDRELSDGIAASFKKRGIKIYTGALAKKVKKHGDLISMQIDTKKEPLSIEAEQVLIAVGRKPVIEGLFKGDMPETNRGYIVTDERHKSSFEGVYAIGDIEFGAPQLAHYAEAAAKNVVDIIFGRAQHINEKLIPNCIYTTPEIASVGLTSRQAKDEKIETIEKKSLSLSNAKSIIETDERGFCKLIFDANDHRLLGAHLLCPHASDMIGMLGAAINCELTAEQLGSAIFPHPTVSELISDAASL